MTFTCTLMLTMLVLLRLPYSRIKLLCSNMSLLMSNNFSSWLRGTSGIVVAYNLYVVVTVVTERGWPSLAFLSSVVVRARVGVGGGRVRRMRVTGGCMVGLKGHSERLNGGVIHVLVIKLIIFHIVPHVHVCRTNSKIHIQIINIISTLCSMRKFSLSTRGQSSQHQLQIYTSENQT